nr:retrovirus-related Pol polyprotein from transposon TNT 1-94 [Tanacetum cinerariifolium]
MIVAEAKENVGSLVVKQSGIQCFNCKEFGHFAKECTKQKRVKDSAYHKEKMLLCKQAEKGVPLQAEQYDWLANTDEEIDEKELEAHYSYMIYNILDMCDDIQNEKNDVESDDERVALANLIANLKLYVDENKKIQKKLKKANTTLAQELKECKTILVETSKTLGESNSIWDSFLVALQNKQTEFEKYKAFNSRTIDYDKLELVKEKHDELIKQSLLTKSHYEGLVKQKIKDMEILIQTCLMPLALKTQNDSFIFIHELKQEMQADLMYVESLEKEIDELESDKAEFSNMYDMILQESHDGQSKVVVQFYLKVLGTVHFGNDQFAIILSYGDLVQGNIMINRVYYVKGLNHNLFAVGQFCDAKLEVAFWKSTCFDRDLQGNNLLTGNHGSNIYTISLQESTSSTPLYLMAKASPTQAWLWHRRLSHLNFDYINLLSKKDIVIGLPKLKYVKDQLCSSCELSKAKRSSFKLKAIPNVLKEFLTMIQRNLQASVITVRTDKRTEFLNKTLNVFFKEERIKHQTSTARTPKQNGVVKRQNHTLVKAAQTMLSASKLPLFFWAEAIATACYTQNRSIIIPYLNKMVLDYDNSDLVPQLHNVYSSADAHVPSQQELGLLFGLLYDEFFTAGSSSVNKYFFPTNNSNQHDTQPTTNIQPTLQPSTSTYVYAEENNDNQAEEEHLQDDEFTNTFCTPVYEVAESYSYNISNSNVNTFNQPQVSEYQWKKDHSLEQVCKNPSKPVQTRRKLATNPEMCMFALTVSTAEPKNIKEAMANSAWIEAMQEELHQFDRLQVWELVDKPFGKSIIRLK